MVTTLGTICTHSQPEMKIFSWLREEPVPCNKNKDICIDPNLDLHLSNFQVTPSHSLTQLRSTVEPCLSTVTGADYGQVSETAIYTWIIINHQESCRLTIIDANGLHDGAWKVEILILLSLSATRPTTTFTRSQQQNAFFSWIYSQSLHLYMYFRIAHVHGVH